MLTSLADAGPILAAALPAPTVDATPNAAIFNNKFAYNPVDGGATTENKYGHLNAGESVSVPLDIDRSGDVSFTLEWGGKEPPVFTLTGPDGQLIDETYAKNHPQDVTFEGTGYRLKKASIGLWELHISAADSGNYLVFGHLYGLDGLMLYAVSDMLSTHSAGEIATFGCLLGDKNGGLAGATVTAIVMLPSMTAESIQLTDMGNGRYAAVYRIPDMTGFATITITAKGSYHGVAFSRQATIGVFPLGK
jgi:hypothetical protein